jgi:ribosomal subunit interface protein
MRVPLEISTRNVDLSGEMEDLIREKAKKLDNIYDQIISCRVMAEVPHRSRQSGVQYNVRIDMTVPGGELVVKREPHQDLHVAITKAFETAVRQVKEFAARQRGEVKFHEEKPIGRISKLFEGEGYGFIATLDGREIYFHENSIIDAKFEDLEVGRVVSFVETVGEKGAMASTVTTS